MSASRASRNAQCVSFAICASIPIRHQHRHRQENDVFTQDREQLRRVFVESWRKFRANEALETLEQLIVQAIHAHPEYHALFDWPDKLLDKDYTPEMGQSNPFLHLGLHIAVQEQVATHRRMHGGDPGVRATRGRRTQRGGLSRVRAQTGLIAKRPDANALYR